MFFLPPIYYNNLIFFYFGDKKTTLNFLRFFSHPIFFWFRVSPLPRDIIFFATLVLLLMNPTIGTGLPLLAFRIMAEDFGYRIRHIRDFKVLGLLGKGTPTTPNI